MSEEIAPATATPTVAENTSTSAIAEQAFDSLEASDPGSGGETGAGAMPSLQAETPAAVPEPVKLSKAAEFLLKQGHKPGKFTKLPYGTVEGMLDRYLAAEQGGWETERGTLTTELTGFRDRFGELSPVLSVLDQGPEAFLKEAARYDPRYQAFLESRQAPQAQAQNPLAELPGPDLEMPGGGRTYSMKGLKESVFPWMLEQAKQMARLEAENLLKPVTEREAAAQARERETAAESQVRERTTATMTEAQTWPHFGALAADGSLSEFQSEVLTILQADSAAAKAAGKRPALTLEGAYIKAVSKRVSEDDKTTRLRLLKETSAAARATPSVPRSGGERPSSGERTRNTRDIASAALAKLEGTA